LVEVEQQRPDPNTSPNTGHGALLV